MTDLQAVLIKELVLDKDNRTNGFLNFSKLVEGGETTLSVGNITKIKMKPYIRAKLLKTIDAQSNPNQAVADALAMFNQNYEFKVSVIDAIAELCWEELILIHPELKPHSNRFAA